MLFVAMIDVLGHGIEADRVAAKAEMFLRNQWNTDIPFVLSSLHDHLKGGRGAAVALSTIDKSSGEMRFAGIGNTVARKFGLREVRFISIDGTLGETFRTPSEQVQQLDPGDVVIFHTDGVKSRFELKDYLQLRYESVATVARNIVKRFGKSYDDAMCAVVRYKP